MAVTSGSLSLCLLSFCSRFVVFPLFLVTWFTPGLQIFGSSPPLLMSSPPTGRRHLSLFEGYWCYPQKHECSFADGERRAGFSFLLSSSGISVRFFHHVSELRCFSDRTVDLCWFAVNANRPEGPLCGFRGIRFMKTWWCIWREFRKQNGFGMMTRQKRGLYLNMNCSSRRVRVW